jgi:hypothetical protein
VPNVCVLTIIEPLLPSLYPNSWGVITVRTEPRRKKVRLITDVTNTALAKEEIAILLYAIQDE